MRHFGVVKHKRNTFSGRVVFTPESCAELIAFFQYGLSDPKDMKTGRKRRIIGHIFYNLQLLFVLLFLEFACASDICY